MLHNLRKYGCAFCSARSEIYQISSFWLIENFPQVWHQVHPLCPWEGTSEAEKHREAEGAKGSEAPEGWEPKSKSKKSSLKKKVQTPRIEHDTIVKTPKSTNEAQNSGSKDDERKSEIGNKELVTFSSSSPCLRRNVKQLKWIRVIESSEIYIY